LAIRVVIADDSLLVRQGIVRLVEDAGFEVVGQACDVDGLLALLASRPDVAIIDIRIPPTFTDDVLRGRGDR
jgi:DNA-binding NarL/FixJ family response regulator